MGCHKFEDMQQKLRLIFLILITFTLSRLSTITRNGGVGAEEEDEADKSGRMRS